MPNSFVDPTTLEGDDLVRWYRRSPWEVEQARQAARLQQYNEFFGVNPGGVDSDIRAADDDIPADPPDVGGDGSQSPWQSPFPTPAMWTASFVPGLLGDLSWLRNQTSTQDVNSPANSSGASDDAQSGPVETPDSVPGDPAVDDGTDSDSGQDDPSNAPTVQRDNPPGSSVTGTDGVLPTPSSPRTEAAQGGRTAPPAGTPSAPPARGRPLPPTVPGRAPALLRISSPAVRQGQSTQSSSSGGKPVSLSQRPSAGILGALFPWAVPVPGGRSLKSAMVTNPSNPRVGPDPSRVEVFQRGADGKLHPIPGWHATGPFDFGTWSHEIDWNGAGQDLGHIGEGVADVMGAEGAGDAILDALGPNVKRAVRRGIFGPSHGHHPIPMVMGGASDQALADLAPPIHRAFHSRLIREMRKAGFPPMTGTAGSAKVWEKLFKADPAKRDQAIEILKRVSHDFDLERGTLITPLLDKELGIVKPVRPSSPK